MAPGPVTHRCSLDIQGKPDGGIEYAGFKCNSTAAGGNNSTGGAVIQGLSVAAPGVKVAMNETRLANFSSNFTGVELSPEDCGGLGCLIEVCGSPLHRIVITDARIAGVVDVGPVKWITKLAGVLCFSGDLHVAIDGMKAERNAASPLFIKGSAKRGVPEVAIQGLDCVNNTMGICIHVRGGPATLGIHNSSISHNQGDVGSEYPDQQVVGLNIDGNEILVSISGTNFSGNTHGSAISVWGSGVAAITNSVFSNNSDATAFTAFGDHGLQVTLESTWFLNNRKRSTLGGTAVAIRGYTRATLRCSQFQDNFLSGGSGAALFCGGGSYAEVSSCSFVNNTAQATMGGGALYVADDAVVVVDNHTEFLSNGASFASGGAAMARYNATVTLTDSCLIQGNYADISGGAIFVFENAVVNITGGSTFANNSANGTGADVHANHDNNLILGETSINARSPGVSWLRKRCLVGEFRDTSSGMCQQCPRSMYSLSGTNSTKGFCEQCPSNANCTADFSIRPLAGFWHSSSSSTQIQRCPRNTSCLQTDVVCAPGYEGHLCGKCVEGWGSEGPFKCGQCMPAWKIMLIFLGVAFGLVVFLLFLVHTTLHDLASGQVRGVAARPSSFLKLMIRHWQYLVIISTVRVGWPESLAAVFTGISMLFSGPNAQAISLDCIYASTGALPDAVKPLIAFWSQCASCCWCCWAGW